MIFSRGGGGQVDYSHVMMDGYGDLSTWKLIEIILKLGEVS